MTYFRPKGPPPVQYLETTLAQYLRRGIPKQSSGRTVPGKDLALLAHAKGGIGCPLQKGEQLTFEHPQTPKRVLVLTGTNGLLKQTSPDTSIRSKGRAVMLYRAVAQAGLSAGATERVFLATY